MKFFLIKTSVLLFLLLIIGFIVYNMAIPEFYSPGYIAALFLIFVVTNAVHAFLLNVLKKKNDKFTQAFMAVKIARLMTYLVFIVIWLFIIREQQALFLINFLVIYIAFTVLDTRETSRAVRKKKNE